MVFFVSFYKTYAVDEGGKMQLSRHDCIGSTHIETFGIAGPHVLTKCDKDLLGLLRYFTMRGADDGLDIAGGAARSVANPAQTAPHHTTLSLSPPYQQFPLIAPNFHLLPAMHHPQLKLWLRLKETLDKHS